MKKRILAFFVFFFSFFAHADDWTLGIMEFSFKQSQKRTESSSKAASVLPQLIIEQFSKENMRTIPQKEQLERKLKDLQTARLSLFLQLSKEYKARDSLILTAKSERALKKSLKNQEEKIRELERKIEENLAEAKKAVEEAAPKIAREEARAEGKKDDEKKDEGRFPFQLPFPFFHKGEKEQIVSENVALYKNDSTTLFQPSEKSMEAGFTSWDFEQEVLTAKIKGLITGEIICYGDYCSVNVSLRVYPGGQIFGSVSEVGLLSDLMPLASSIARNLDSKIANALPVMLEFEIEPKEIEQIAQVMIDGVVFSLKRKDGTFENKIIKESGIHNINVTAPGYEDLAFTYSFSDENHFFIHARLVPEVHGTAKIKLKKFRDGIFHTGGLRQAPVSEEMPVAQIEVNHKSILGVFMVPKQNEEDSASSNIAFFQIPESQAFDGANLLLTAKPFDRAANIDKRRRWMYTAYTALICSLPFTFYYLGEFTAENTAYSQGRGDYDRLLELQQQSNISMGITAAFGVWAAIELVRYLWAADRVLPAKTKIDRKAMRAEAFSQQTLKEESAIEEVEVSEKPAEDAVIEEKSDEKNETEDI